MFMGRRLSTVNMGNPGGVAGRTYPSGMFPDPWSWVHGQAMWPRSPALCAPQAQCCCKGPWQIGPGERQPLFMDLTNWINGVPGYNLNAVESASLWDMNKAPPAVADPDVIKVISGLDDSETPDNEHAEDFISISPPCAAQAVIEAAPDARIGSQYKLDICFIARDCDGRKIRLCDCIVITIAEC